MAKKILGVMGPGTNPTQNDLKNAYDLGHLSATMGFVTLTGGSKAGVMNEALKGAKDGGGDTIGILAFADKTLASDYADIVIVTAMGSARNNINILSCDIIVACGMEAGTLSEVALALKAKKKVILLNDNVKAKEFLEAIGKGEILVAQDFSHARKLIEQLVNNDQD